MTTSVRRTEIVTLLLAGLLWASPARALTLNGDSFSGNSWAQGFINSSGPYYSFDKMLVYSQSGVGFEAPAFRDFSSSGWSTTASSGSLWAIATGPMIDADKTLTFNLYFNDPQIQALTFDFYAFSSGAVKEATRATWNGSAWAFSAAPVTPPAVPDGGMTLVLLGTSLAGLRLLRRRVN